jgi:hypothetical protein
MFVQRAWEGNRGTSLHPGRPAHTPGTGSSGKPLPGPKPAYEPSSRRACHGPHPGPGKQDPENHLTTAKAKRIRSARFSSTDSVGWWPRITDVRFPVPGSSDGVGRRLESGEPAGVCRAAGLRRPAYGSGPGIKATVFSLGFSDRDRSRRGGGLGGLRRLRYHRTSVPVGKSSTRPTSW